MDRTVHVWSPTTGECTAVLQGHEMLVGHLQLEDDILITGGSDGRVCIVRHRFSAHVCVP
jgi:F-box and WD-40 domain protein CDC4